MPVSGVVRFGRDRDNNTPGDESDDEDYRICSQNGVTSYWTGEDDIVLFRLNRRVGPSLAVPRRIVTRTPEGPGPISLHPPGSDDFLFWNGQPVRLVGYGQDLMGMPQRRQTGEGAVVDSACFACRSNEIVFVSPFTVTPGDSGGPWFWTAPDGEELITAVVRSSFATATWSTGDSFGPTEGADVATWIEDTLDPDRDGQLLGELPAGPLTAAQDPDGDGIPSPGVDPDISDNCPDAGDPNPDQLDSDCDGWGDVCDVCRFIADPGQEDCDGDETGDACAVDADADGYIDVCGRDNCTGCSDPRACRNADQSNCNLDAELTLGLTPLGDVCDSVPCGDTLIETRDELLDSRGRPSFIGMTHMDVIRVDTRSSVIMDGRTGFRFCPCEAGTTNDPAARRACAFARCPLARPDLYDISEFQPMESNWRDATVSGYAPQARTVPPRPQPIVQFGDCPSGTPADCRTEAIGRYGLRRDVDGYRESGTFQTELLGRWALRRLESPILVATDVSDEARWVRRFALAPDGSEPPPNSRRPGVFATHTPGDSRLPVTFFSDTIRERAFHYSSGFVEPPTLFAVEPEEPVDIPLPFLYPPVCTFCASGFPDPFLALPCVRLADEPGCAPPGEVFLAFGGGLRQGASYFPDGPPYFASDLTWVAAAEPREHVGSASLRYVGLDPASLSISRVLVETAAGTIRPRELAGCTPPFCNFLVCDNPDGCSADASSLPDPVLVLSATRHTLWLVGSEIRAIDLGADLLGHLNDVVPLAEPLGLVRAATYSAADGRLYILDEVALHGRARRVRLLRVDPRAGTVDVVGDWPARGSGRRYAMAPAPDGSLWIATSGEHGAHFAAWLDPRGESVSLRGVAVGAGALAGPTARASRIGLSMVVEAEGRARPVGYRAEDTRGARGHRIEELF